MKKLVKIHVLSLHILVDSNVGIGLWWMKAYAVEPQINSRMFFNRSLTSSTANTVARPRVFKSPIQMMSLLEDCRVKANFSFFIIWLGYISDTYVIEAW